MSYTLTQQEYSNLKRRLSRLRNQLTAAAPKDKPAIARKVITECNHADAVFDEKGYPDFWNNWVRAKEDAEYLIRRAEAGLPI